MQGIQPAPSPGSWPTGDNGTPVPGLSSQTQSQRQPPPPVPPRQAAGPTAPRRPIPPRGACQGNDGVSSAKGQVADALNRQTEMMTLQTQAQMQLALMQATMSMNLTVAESIKKMGQNIEQLVR